MADDVTLRIRAEVEDAIRKVAQLREEYLKNKATWTGAAAEATRALNAFSGDKVIRDATNAARAVQQVGGVTKLTAAEQRRLNQLLQEAVEKYNVLGREAPKNLVELRNATATAGIEAQKSSGFFDRMFFRLTGAFTAADLSAKLIVGAINLIKDAAVGAVEAVAYLVDQGSKVQMIAGAFNKLQGAIGEYGGRTLDEARRKTQGLITDFDLMQNANRAMLFGLQVTPEKFGILGEAAIKLSRAMGIDAPRAMSDLVLAMGRVSPRILDNLGIIVKVGEANAKWAAAHHETIKEMTAGERVQAFYTEAMKKIEEHVGHLGDITLTLKDRLQQMHVWWTNLVNDLSLAVSVSPVLTMLFGQLALALQGGFGEHSAILITTIVHLIDEAAIAVVGLAQRAVDMTLAIHSNVSEFKAIVAGFAAGLNEIVLIVETGIRNLLSEEAKIPFLGKKYAEAAESMSALVEAQKAKTKASRDDYEAAVRGIKGEDDFSKALKTTSAWLQQTKDNMVEASKTRVDYKNVIEKGIIASEAELKLRQAEEEAERNLMKTEKTAKTEKEKLVKETQDLVVSLQNASEHGATVSVVMKEYGAKITDVVNRSKVFGIEVPQSILNWKNAIDNAIPSKDKFIKAAKDMVEILAQTSESMDISEIAHAYGANIEMIVDKLHTLNIPVPEILEQWNNTLHQYHAVLNQLKKDATETEASITRRVAAQDKVLATRRDYEGKLKEITDSGIKARLAALNLEEEQARDKLGPNSENVHDYQEAVDAMTAYFKKKREEILGSWAFTFRDIALSLPKTIIGAIKGGGEALKAAISDIGSQIGRRLFSSVDKEGNATGINKLVGDSIVKLTSKLSPALGAAFKGVLGTLVPGIGAVIGALAGPLASKIKQLFTGPSMNAKVAADLGRDYGQAFSKNLVDAITADAKRIGDRQAAIALHLADVIKESGGVTAGTLDKWTKKAQDVFRIMNMGLLSTEEGTKTLSEVFPLLSAQVQKTGGIWSTTFRNMVQQVKDSHLAVEGLDDLMAKEQDKLSGATSKVVKGFTQPLLDLINAADEADTKLEGGLIGEDAFKKGGTYAAGLIKQIGTIQAQIKDLEDKGSDRTNKQNQDLQDYRDKLKTLQYEYQGLSQTQKDAGAKLELASAKAQDEFERLSRIALRSFNLMVASGKSPVEAIEAEGESIDDLITVVDKLGLKSSDAFNELKRWRQLTVENKPLLDEVSSLNDLLTSTVNLGGMTEDAFADFTAQGVEGYRKLITAGFTQQEAEKMEASFLENVIKLHNERGYAIDEETQKLIDQAQQDGVLKAQEISTNDILMQGLGAIIEAVGGTLPDAWKKMADKAKESAKTAADATDGVLRKVDDVGSKLGDATHDWQVWKDTAVDAAGDVQDAVDGVSFGHSPGGLKEWRPLFMQAHKAMKEFASDAVSNLNRVKGTMDDLPAMTVGDAGFRSPVTQQAAPTAPSGSSRVVYVAPDAVKISTWSLGQKMDVVREELAALVLKALSEGGDNYGMLTNIVNGLPEGAR